MMRTTMTTTEVRERNDWQIWVAGDHTDEIKASGLLGITEIAENQLHIKCESEENWARKFTKVLAILMGYGMLVTTGITLEDGRQWVFTK